MRYIHVNADKGVRNTAPKPLRALRAVAMALTLFVALTLSVAVALNAFSTEHSTVFAHRVILPPPTPMPPSKGKAPTDTPTSVEGKPTSTVGKPISTTVKGTTVVGKPTATADKPTYTATVPKATSVSVKKSTATPTSDANKKENKAPTPTGTSTDTPPTIESMPTFIINMTPIPEARYEGWERPTLRDLADVNAWPTVVVYDTSGRLKVQNTTTEALWGVRAHVRAFDFGAGASAAFNAEQEDAQLGGFQVTPQTFYTYRAYEGSIVDRNGVVREARFRWLAATWIFGIDIRPTQGQTTPDMRLLSEQLLTLATNRGLPPPPIVIPTANPTWHLPPNATPTVQSCGIVFSDVSPDYWAYRYIVELACAGKITGYEDGTFRPDSPTTRAQIAKLLVLTQGWSLVTSHPQSFQDVGRNHPFYQYIETAADHGVVSGYADGAYRPDAYVTRAQLAKMLVLARHWQPFQPTPVLMCDVTPDHWAWYYVQAAFQNGLFTGYEERCFHPDKAATRSELAKLLVYASR